MKLYATVQNERLQRPARKGADRRMVITLTDGNKPAGEIVFERQHDQTVLLYVDSRNNVSTINILK